MNTMRTEHLRLTLRSMGEPMRFPDLIRADGVSVDVLRGRVTARDAQVEVALSGRSRDIGRALQLYRNRGLAPEPAGPDCLRQISNMRRLFDRIADRETAEHQTVG